MRWIGDISVKSPLLQAPRRPWSSATWRCWWPSRYRSRSRWWCCCRWCRCCHLTLGGGIWWKCLGEFRICHFFREKWWKKSQMATYQPNVRQISCKLIWLRELKRREFVLGPKKLHESECSWSWPTNLYLYLFKNWMVSQMSLLSNNPINFT